MKVQPIRYMHVQQQALKDMVLGSRAGRWGNRLPEEKASLTKGPAETSSKVWVSTFIPWWLRYRRQQILFLLEPL